MVKPRYEPSKPTLTYDGQGEAYTVIDMGFGKWEVGAGTNAGTPCIAFGVHGSGKVGELITIEPRQMSAEETHAVITFANYEGFAVLQEKMDEVRALHFRDAQAWQCAEAQPAPVPAGDWFCGNCRTPVPAPRSAAPAPAVPATVASAAPMTDEQREQVFRDAENRMMRNINLSWRDAVVECVEAHHRIGQQTAPAVTVNEVNFADFEKLITTPAVPAELRAMLSNTPQPKAKQEGAPKP